MVCQFRVGWLVPGALLVLVVACSGGGKSATDAVMQETSVEAASADGPEAGGDGESLGSEVSLPPEPCQGQPLDGAAGHLLPQPARVFRYDGPLELVGNSVRWGGLTAGVEEELLALADARGLVEGSGQAAVEIAFYPLSAWETVVASCDSAESVGESYYLEVDVINGGALVRIAAADAAGRFYALKTLRQLLEGGDSVTIRPVAIYDRPAIATRGVLEGFYGQPWLPEERLLMVAESAHLKFNSYIYAPKGAATINTAWMLPFEKEELEHFAELVEVAKRNYVRVCFEIHPSFLFHYSTQGDFDTLLGKFESVIALGIDCVVLAFDDVPAALVPPDGDLFGSYTAAQVDFLPRLGDALLSAHPDLQLAFVPVEYYTQHEDAATAWPALGAALQPQWEIAWTGQQIGSTTVTLADAQEATALMGRKPLLGDNYPVSDDAYKTGIVHLGPLGGREAKLVESLSGLAFNAMPLAPASLPALATCADYSWNPGSYDPQASAARVARFYGGESAESGFLTLLMANRSPMLDGSHAPELEAALASLWGAWEGTGDVSAAQDLLRTAFFAPYAAVPGAFAKPGMHTGVREQLLPWAEALGGYGAVGEQALDLLAASAAGEAFDTEQFVGEVNTLAEGFARPTGKAMDDFLARVLMELE